MPLPKASLKVKAFEKLEISCAKFPKRLMNNSTDKMIAKIIQPRLLRDLIGGGGVITGGDDVNGGGAPGEPKDDISIARDTSPE
jgi:hypothetical protein